MTILHDVLWVEKYRPKSLDELALSEDNHQLLSSYLESGEIPHLLMIGPPGSGKTTIAHIIGRSIPGEMMVLNASSDRGIDVVRGKITEFSRARGILAEGLNKVFLDEADAMTADAQTALRNLMETYSEHTRFMLSGNYIHRIIGPIQSRCMLIELGPPPLKERFRVLTKILEAEGIEADVPTAASYAERYPDLRRMIMAAQRAYLSHGTLPKAGKAGPAQGDDILKAIKQKAWKTLRNVTTSGTFDPQEALRELFWAIPDDDPKVGFLRATIGKAVHESGFSPDPIIHFLGVCGEAMEG